MTAYYKDYSTLGNRARQVWGPAQGDGSRKRKAPRIAITNFI